MEILTIKTFSGIKFFLFTLIIFCLFLIYIYLAGYFEIGILSDTYLDSYSSIHSTSLDKITGNLPFKDNVRFRPLEYFTLEGVSELQKNLNIPYDNFILYRIINLVFYFVISFLAGKIILSITADLKLSLLTLFLFLIFPNNIHNICWSSGIVDLLCTMFYLSTLYFMILYLKEKNPFNFLLSGVFFLLALLTKETAISLPFVSFLYCVLLAKKTLSKFKKIFILQFCILTLYFLYRFIYLQNVPIDSLNLNFSNPIENFFSVITRSIISITVPLDYLSLKVKYLEFDFFIVIYSISFLFLLLNILILTIKKNLWKYFLIEILILLTLILPFILVGYVRPQIIMIPFTVMLINSIFIYWKISSGVINFKKGYINIVVLIIIIFWINWGFNLIREWNYVYKESKILISNLLKYNLDGSSKNLFVGSPARFKQAFIFDNLIGPYNYWKYKEFSITDNLEDILKIGALDSNSLNAELIFRNLDSNYYEISTTGMTQFFINPDLKNLTYSNPDYSIELFEINYFNKPTKAKLKMLNENCSFYLLSNKKIHKLEN